MDDPLLETKLDFDEYLKQVGKRSVSNVHVRGTTATESMNVRKIMYTIDHEEIYGMVRC
jgi:hypothetical protein